MTRRAHIAILFVVSAVVASLLPIGAVGAQGDATATCARGVLIEGRCLSIDGQATDCLDGGCIEFVEEVTQVCPAGMTPVAASDDCERFDPPVQRPEGCPEGARGEVNDCHIFVAKGPDGCPIGSLEVLSGDCKKAVANASGAYYCELEDQQLLGLECWLVQPREPSACPAGTVRFDAACWRLGTLNPPESCAGYGLAQTVELSSGRCRVPELVWTGDFGCVEGTELLQGVQWVEYEPSTETTVLQGPLVVGCTQRGNVGLAISSCLFDRERWGGDQGDDIDGVRQCTRFDAPRVATCADGYSLDDSLGGRCARFAPVTSFDPPECPDGWTLNGSSCVQAIEFEEFTCPDGMERREGTTRCQEFRPLRLTYSCTVIGLLASDGCWAFVGPQPNTCNALGTIDDCYNIREPARADCALAQGCIGLGDFSILGDVDCDAGLTIIDALLIAQYSALVRQGHDACADRAPTTQLFVNDGDVNGDESVDIIDALQIAQCVAGIPSFDGCR